MGSFSWLRASVDTKRANIVEGDAFKMLIPKEFVPKYGNFIRDHYEGYGRINFNGMILDMYGMIAYMNANMPFNTGKIGDFYVKTDDGFKDTNLDKNRSLGITLACYEEDHRKIKYPLKLVSVNFKGTYEDCDGYSISDPNQGFFKTYWDTSIHRMAYGNLTQLDWVKNEWNLWHLNRK